MLMVKSSCVMRCMESEKSFLLYHGPLKVRLSRVLFSFTSDCSSTEIPSALITVPLSHIAFGRSGDKGDVANIGIVCRHPRFFPLVGAQVTAEVLLVLFFHPHFQRVQEYMPHLLKGRVTRYQLPGIHAFNFVCTSSLDSGGASSLNMDRQGKCYAQILLDLPVAIPIKALLESKL